jgi:hypothetical protein
MIQVEAGGAFLDRLTPANNRGGDYVISSMVSMHQPAVPGGLSA